MNAVVKWLRQLLLTVLILLCAAWASGEGAQWLLRWRAQRLLTDIRSLEVNRSGWSDAQAVIKKWGRSGTSTGSCTSEACNYRIDLVQTIPPMLVGHPDENANNSLPRLMDHIGLRSAAARAGFTVEYGVVTSKWFGEQVTLPIRDWTQPSDYVPYLSVSSGEISKFRGCAGGDAVHPHRVVQNTGLDLGVTFSPEEDSSEKAALMDFRFSCITQFRPCEKEGEILPEGANLLQEQEHSLRTR
jgi:hypothetical protein